MLCRHFRSPRSISWDSQSFLSTLYRHFRFLRSSYNSPGTVSRVLPRYVATSGLLVQLITVLEQSVVSYHVVATSGLLVQLITVLGQSVVHYLAYVATFGFLV